MRIDTEGKVGIGGTPSYALDVHANLEGNVARFYNDGNDGNRDVLILQGGADAGGFNTRFISLLDGDGGGVGYIQGANDDGNDGIAINVNADGKDLVVAGTGRVGIGVREPEAALHITGSGAAATDFSIDSGITPGQQTGSIKIQYQNDNDYSLNLGWDPAIIARSGNTSGRNFTIAMRNGGTPDTNDSSIHFETGGRNGAPGSVRMVIHDGGNIGIGGVTDPDSELEIFHATDPQLKFTINTHGDAGLLLADADGLKIFGQGGSNQIRFHADTTEKMRIDSTGVGIGTTSPQTILHISENTNSNLEIDGSTAGEFRLISINDARNAYEDLKLFGDNVNINANASGKVLLSAPIISG